MSGIVQDLRYALRGLGKSPGFTTVAVLTLALGIGVNTAIFTVLNAVLLRSLPLAEPDRIFRVQTIADGTPRPSDFVYPTFLRIKNDAASLFAAAAASGTTRLPVIANSARFAAATFVTEQYFDVLSLRPVLGRGFSAAEHRLGADPVVVLTDAFWRSAFGQDRAAIGATIRIGERAATIVGVLPRGFRGLDLTSPADLFMPLTSATLTAPTINYLADVAVNGYSPTGLSVTAKLGDRVTWATAEAALTTIHATYRRDNGPVSIMLTPMSTAALPARSREETSRFIYLLVAVGALVLLVGCASLAALILARSEERTSEMALRAALGATRITLLRLFAAENLVLISAGLGSALLVSEWMLDVLRAFVLPGRVNLEALQLGLSLRAVMFAAAVALLTVLLCGIVPAVRVRNIDAMLRLRSRRLERVGERALVPNLLVGGQIAIALMLIVGAGLFARSLQKALSTDVGFDADRLAFAEVSFRDARYDANLAARFYEEIPQRLRGAPGVESVTFGDFPLGGFGMSTPEVRVDGETRRFPQNIQVYRCGPEYFRTMGIPILAGRPITASDTSSSEPVIVVSEQLARALWPGEDAIGKALTFLPLTKNARVVGVASDLKYSNLRETGTRAMYVPWQQNRLGVSGRIVVRAGADPSPLVPMLRSAVRQFDRGLPISAASTVAGNIRTLVMPQRFGVSLLGWFSLLAITLAVVGVYGLVAYTVERRTHEVGVRVALGATSPEIVWLMTTRAAVPIVIGILTGLAGAYALSRLAQPFLFEVMPHDPATYATVTALVFTATLLASYIPARRAARVDPLVALRYE